MRPGDFSPGNKSYDVASWAGFIASMRPGDFSPGNPRSGRRRPRVLSCASMRPGDFSPGNAAPPGWRGNLAAAAASMRPGDFSPGNGRQHNLMQFRDFFRFNEAGGFLPRKHRDRVAAAVDQESGASMRPGDFSPGNPRMHGGQGGPDQIPASMRPGDFSPGNVQAELPARGVDASMRPGDFSPGNASEAAGCSQSRASLQ